MKFNINDKVRVVADKEKLAAEGLEDLELIGQEGVIHSIEIHGEGIDIAVEIGKDIWSFDEEDLELVEEVKTEFIQDGEIRTFDSGATRDTDIGKWDYEGFLSPLVLKRYAEYMHKCRIQSDGKLRESDNWQKGIPVKQYMKSKWRHFMDTWLWWRSDIHRQQIDVEDALCAELFNTQGMLHEVLRDELNEKVNREGPVPGGY